MDFTQIIPLTKGMRVATHTSGDTISWNWESGTAYPFNTVIWYDNIPFVSIRNVPADAGNPKEEPGFWAYLSMTM